MTTMLSLLHPMVNQWLAKLLLLPMELILPHVSIFRLARGDLKKSVGLGKNHLGGKDRGEKGKGRPRRQWERDIDAFDRSITEAGRWALDRSHFRCAVEDATSIRISS